MDQARATAPHLVRVMRPTSSREVLPPRQDAIPSDRRNSNPASLFSAGAHYPSCSSDTEVSAPESNRVLSLDGCANGTCTHLNSLVMSQHWYYLQPSRVLERTSGVQPKQPSPLRPSRSANLERVCGFKPLHGNTRTRKLEFFTSPSSGEPPSWSRA